MSESKIDKLITQVRDLKTDLAAVKKQALEAIADQSRRLDGKIDAAGEELGRQLAEAVNRVTATEAAATALAAVVAEIHEEVFGNGDDGPSTPQDVFDLEISGEEQNG